MTFGNGCRSTGGSIWLIFYLVSNLLLHKRRQFNIVYVKSQTFNNTQGPNIKSYFLSWFKCVSSKTLEGVLYGVCHDSKNQHLIHLRVPYFFPRLRSYLKQKLEKIDFNFYFILIVIAKLFAYHGSKTNLANKEKQ